MANDNDKNPNAFSAAGSVRRKAKRGSPAAIHAELIGSDRATIGEISITAAAPVLALCRRLVDAGYDPKTPLVARRGRTVCLCVRAIGEAARLEIRTKGGGFKPSARVSGTPLVPSGDEVLPD
jgi:hypothetical protein